MKSLTQSISYDLKRKSIMKRTTKKRRLTLDCSILITTEEKLISTEHSKTFEIIGVGMAITYATLDREKKDEEELAVEGVGTYMSFGEILLGLHIGHGVLDKQIPGCLLQIHK
jgi:hypothetical protein